MPELLTDEERETVDAVESGEDDSSSGSDMDDEDDEDGNDPTLGGFIAFDDEEDEYEPENNAENEGVAGPSNSKDKRKKKPKKSKGKKKKKKVTTLAELKANSSRSKAAKARYLKRLQKSFVSSAKIDKTMETLEQIMEDPEQERVLVFSQWTSLLDLLEIPIAGKQTWGYRRYDGSMSATARADAVDEFRNPQKNVRIMLVSLKAGNAGLNLNSASQVIILDPFWNPYIEEQAIDRAHRLGQLRPVTVHRILVQETVEDRIVALQEKKRALISEALDEQQASQIARLDVHQLAYLFGVTHDPSQRINYTPRERGR